MRIRIVGTGAYSHVNVEYDVLMSSTVMSIKARIMVFMGMNLRLFYRMNLQFNLQNNNSHIMELNCLIWNLF